MPHFRGTLFLPQMNLSKEQNEALDKVGRWIEDSNGSQVFHVFGYAGSGKTTIAKEFRKKIRGTVLFAAFTGKAAFVMRQNGCLGADTLHSLIYLPSSKSLARLKELQAKYVEEMKGQKRQGILASFKTQIDKEKENVKRPSFSINHESSLKDAELLIIDEVSMVSKQMAEDILSFGVRVLVLGDPAQLPPVKGGGYFTKVTPDVMLSQVHRQAANSPILAAATSVREGKGLFGCPLVVGKGKLSIEDLAEFDQILVGTNASRKAINKQMREHLGYPTELPVAGDRLICTKNDRDTGLLNGSQWTVLDAHPDDGLGRVSLHLDSPETNQKIYVEAHSAPFFGEEPNFYEIRDAQCFEYAYAMTVHKAQGSQFNNVLLIDESSVFPEHQRRSWLYTGITRAAKQLTIIQ